MKSAGLIPNEEPKTKDHASPFPLEQGKPMMGAIVSTKYGSPDVLQLREVEKPTPKEGEVLIKVHAATVTAADGMMRKGIPYYGRLFLGLTKPKNPTPGTGFAGMIESVGKEVGQFKAGDRVFGEVIFGAGTNAEYTIVPEEGVLAIMPDNRTWSEAAPVCDGALTSLNFLRNLANIQRGQKVLINGASGGLGTSAVQLAKHFGAEVTGVCSSENVEMVESIGADEVIDYTKEDFTKNGSTYDIIYDTVGKSSFARCKGSLTEKGIFVSPVLSLALLLQMIWTSKFSNRKAKFSATGILPVAKLRTLLLELKGLFETGKLSTVIDRTYPLEEVPEAHRYVDKGHKKGNVVITLD